MGGTHYFPLPCHIFSFLQVFLGHFKELYEVFPNIFCNQISFCYKWCPQNEKYHRVCCSRIFWIQNIATNMWTLFLAPQNYCSRYFFGRFILPTLQDINGWCVSKILHSIRNQPTDVYPPCIISVKYLYRFGTIFGLHLDNICPIWCQCFGRLFDHLVNILTRLWHYFWIICTIYPLWSLTYFTLFWKYLDIYTIF